MFHNNRQKYRCRQLISTESQANWVQNQFKVLDSAYDLFESDFA